MAASCSHKLRLCGAAATSSKGQVYAHVAANRPHLQAGHCQLCHEQRLLPAACTPEDAHASVPCCGLHPRCQHCQPAPNRQQHLSQQASQLLASAFTSAVLLTSGVARASEDLQAAAAAAQARVQSGEYVPSPIEPGWEVWVGTIAGIIPFAIGSYEFGKRILIQRNCKLCGGRGLVPSTNAGAKYMRKCPECGGFFPWVSWKLFLTSTAAPGNGGPLQRPKGQTSVFYKVPDAPTKEEVQEARAKYMSQGEASASPSSNKQDEPGITTKVPASGSDKSQEQ